MNDTGQRGRLQISRRTFIRAAGVAGAGFVLYAYTPAGTRQAVAAIPGGNLDPVALPKYVTPLLIPPVMPRAATIKLAGGKPADYYEISVKQISQQILPAGLPKTTVWAYGAVTSGSKNGLLIHNAPSLTIESRWDRPVRVKWINDLRDAKGNYLPHLLPVDPTLHWANPPVARRGATRVRTSPDAPMCRRRSSPTRPPSTRGTPDQCPW